MYSLIRQLNRKDGGGGVRLAAATWPAWRWWRPAAWLWRRRCRRRTGRWWGGASRSDWCCRHRWAGGPSGASGPSGSWRSGASACWSGSRWWWSRAWSVLPVLGRRAGTDAGGDGGSPRGAPSGRGRHGTSGTLAGRRAMTRFGRTMVTVVPGARAGGSGGAARWPRRSTRRLRSTPPAPGRQDQIDIAHHIANSHEVEIPFGGVWHLPRLGARSTVGGLRASTSRPPSTWSSCCWRPTLVALVFVLSARSIARAQAAGPAAQGLRRRDGGDGALHPAGGRPAERRAITARATRPTC